MSVLLVFLNVCVNFQYLKDCQTIFKQACLVNCIASNLTKFACLLPFECFVRTARFLIVCAPIASIASLDDCSAASVLHRELLQIGLRDLRSVTTNTAAKPSRLCRCIFRFALYSMRFPSAVFVWWLYFLFSI